MTSLDHSPSATVRRHASAFARTWPEPAPAPGSYRLLDPPAPTARRIGVDELGTGRSPRLQAARAAEECGWAWVAHLAVAPDGSGAWSVVMRFRRPAGWPWQSQRLVARWRAKGAEGRLAFADAWAWRLEHGMHDLAAVAGSGLVAHLRGPGVLAPARTVPKVTRALSAI